MRITTKFLKAQAMQARHLFWEFYALNHLWFRLGDGAESYGYQPINIVSESLRNKINYKFEAVTDKLFRKIKKALLKSIRSEMKYPFEKINALLLFSDEKAPYHIKFPFIYFSWKKLFTLGQIFHKYLDYMREKAPYVDVNTTLEAKDIPIEWAPVAFKWEGWGSDYCGEGWAKACYVYMEADKCKTLKQKVAWIDKVLDLQHNSGFILDKTPFAALSSGDWNENDLDIRAEVRSWPGVVNNSQSINLVVNMGGDRNDGKDFPIEQETVPLSSWTRGVILANAAKL